MGYASSTSKDETSGLLAGDGPIGDERLVRYNIFQTMAFDAMGVMPPVTKQHLEGASGPDTIDGFANDDSYRRSRHLLTKATPAQRAVNVTNLRENSLARQLSEKRDQPATIRLIRRLRGEELMRPGAGDQRAPWVNLVPPNTKFFLEQIGEAREEKVQVIDTFGEWVAFFFGRKPEVYNYSGTLLNAKNHDWKNEFQANYDQFLRGSQAVKYRATMILQYDDVMVEGYMMNCAISQSAAADKSVPFQFTLLVINRSSLNPERALAQRQQRSRLSSLEQMVYSSMQPALEQLKQGDLTDLETFLIMREYLSGNYIPPAGTLTFRDRSIGSSESATPGARGGVTNPSSTPAPLTTPTSSAISAAGVEPPEGSPALEAFKNSFSQAL
jgi:hypothetical protein